MYRQHRLLPKGIDLFPAYKRNLLELELVRAIAQPRLSIASPAYDGEPRTVPQTIPIRARILVAELENMLGEALQIVLVERVEVIEPAGRVKDARAMACGPATNVESDKVTEFPGKSLNFMVSM